MYLAIDIGGTNTRLGVSRNGRDFFAFEKFKTPRKYGDGIRMIVDYIQRLGLRRDGGRASRYRIDKISVALPGSINNAPNKRTHLPNLPGWSGKPIAQKLAGQFHTKVQLINDADAAGIGEALRGAGRGYRRVAYFTISTGIGGARIHQGVADGAAQDFSARGGCALGAEPGHQILVPRGRKCPCGQRGCFEAYGSGTAFYKTYGVRPEDCRNKKIWARHAQIIGWGLINTIVHWSPDVVVLGGGLTQAGPMLFTPLRSYVRTHLKVLKPPPIKRAKLGDDAGLYGCLELMR